MAREFTAADIRAIADMVMRGSLENVLLAVGFGCAERAKTLGGTAADAWVEGKIICEAAADKAREAGL